MQHTADNLISDLASTIAFYDRAKRGDRDLEEIHNVAEAAMNMLVIIRRHQLDKRSSDDTDPDG